MEAIRHIDYEGYFQYVVSQHPLLQVEADEQVFGMIDIEESFGQLKSKVKIGGFFFRLFRYMYRAGQSSGGQNVDKKISAGWMIAKMIRPSNITKVEKELALAEVERINDDFIERIVSDSRNRHPLFLSSLDSQQDFATTFLLHTGDGSYIGCRTTFHFQHYIPICLDREGATQWLDGGLTPNTIP